MIRAQIMKDGSNRIKGFRITGHAGYAPEGRDIVCAAVSILSISVVNSLEQQLGEVGRAHEEKGSLEFMLTRELSADETEKAQAILRTLEIGLDDLRKTYPQYVAVEKLKIRGGA